MKHICISCEGFIEDINAAIVWTDTRIEPGDKQKRTHVIHLSCFNNKNYKGLHQNIEPDKFD